jgi:FeS assembly protein IscX
MWTQMQAISCLPCHPSGVETMKWSDSFEIAIALDEAHQEVDPQYVRFTDLHAWICALDDFDDEPDNSNELILEAIQMAWIDERED